MKMIVKTIAVLTLLFAGKVMALEPNTYVTDKRSGLIISRSIIEEKPFVDIDLLLAQDENMFRYQFTYCENEENLFENIYCIETGFRFEQDEYDNIFYSYDDLELTANYGYIITEEKAKGARYITITKTTGQLPVEPLTRDFLTIRIFENGAIIVSFKRFIQESEDSLEEVFRMEAPVQILN